MNNEMKERLDAVTRVKTFATKIDLKTWHALSQMLKVSYPYSLKDKTIFLFDIIQSFKPAKVVEGKTCPDCGKVSLDYCNCGQ